MAKLLSDRTAKKLQEVLEKVNDMELRSRQETRRRVRTGGSGGGSLVYATSPNTTFDASFTYGATVPFPGDTAANSTALSSGVTFYLSTPWNTRITAPDELFSFWNKIGDNYYLGIDTFYVKPSANYSATPGTGITTFTAYWNKVATHALGTNTAFPSGIKILLDGFDAANASTNSLNYFNGKIFECTYDSENNIIYLDHPVF